MKFLQKDIEKFKRMSDKRKYKTIHLWGKRKAWNRGKRTDFFKGNEMFLF